MDTRGHLLIVDDDPDVRSTLADYFQAHGFAISTAGDGGEMRAALCGNPVDVVLMDLHLPGEDGLVLTRELRAKGGVGIVMVTGVGETVDRVIGLEMGADDYVAKPFDLRELLARVRSVLRRVRTGQSSVPEAPANPKEKIRVGHCTLDLAARKLFGRFGYIRETIFGGLWSLSAELKAHDDTAYTTQYLEPHTDATYSHYAPGLQCFLCQELDGKGGESEIDDVTSTVSGDAGEISGLATATADGIATNEAFTQNIVLGANIQFNQMEVELSVGNMDGV